MKFRSATAPLIVTRLQYSFAFAYSVDQCSGYLSFAGAFQQFRINRVYHSIYPAYQANMLENRSNPDDTEQPPYLEDIGYWNSVIDVDDDAVLEDTDPQLTSDVFRQYATYKRTPGTRKVTRVLSPCVLGMNYESISSTAYTPRRKQWISFSDVTTPHYGTKFAFMSYGIQRAVTNDETYNRRFYQDVWYSISFRNKS